MQCNTEIYEGSEGMMKYMLRHMNIVIMISCYLIYLWVICKFLKKYLSVSKRNEKLFVAFGTVGLFLVNRFSTIYSIPYIVLAMLWHISFIVLVLLMFKADLEKKILAASMLTVTASLVGNFCESFFTCVALTAKYMMNKEQEPVLEYMETNIILYIRFAIGILIIYILSKHMIQVFSCNTKKWYVILSVPMLSITAVIDVVNWGASNGIFVRGRQNMGLYYDQILSHSEICVLTVLSMFAIGFYVFGMDRIYLEQKKSSQYHWQVEIYRMMEEQYRQSERLRHDMKNHIIAMSGLCLSEEWEKLGSYLKHMKDGCLETDGDITGNKAVDALLYQKRKWADKGNIEWECDVQVPKAGCMNEFDLCVLFGNLLDNALEACEKLGSDERRFIRIHAKTVKKCFLLEVKNSASASKQDTKDVTNKLNSYEHGIGLLNVGDVVHRYNGVVNIENESGNFVISILIPFDNPAYDIKQIV